MKPSRAAIAVSCLALATLAACSSSDKPAEPAKAEPLTVRDSVDVTVTSKVKAVDYTKRLLTLRDEAGHENTFLVGPQVKRLEEVKAGDNVKARYQAELLAELRPPTPAEAAEPIAVVQVAGRAPRSDAPAAGALQGVRVVTKVEAVDVPNLRVTLRGPMGDLAVVQGKKAENVKRLKVGDTIVITYAEAAAVSLEKVAPR